MRRSLFCCVWCSCWALLAIPSAAIAQTDQPSSSQKQVSQNQVRVVGYDRYKKQIEEQRKVIPQERLELLKKGAVEIKAMGAKNEKIDLVFVCTHNSRRSQLAQLWCQVAAEQMGLKKVRCHSCGTERTACNPRTVAALERAGLEMERRAGEVEDNPIYSIRVPKSQTTVELFSKAFGHASLPTQDFVALMCCDDADKNCPRIPGASSRVRLSYVDPKVNDGRSNEAQTYDERSLQIASEMFELLTLVSQ